MVELFGVIEIALPEIDAAELLSGSNPVKFSAQLPFSKDSCWHQDGSHTKVPTEGYKIGLVWPHTRVRISVSTEIVPIGAFAESTEAALKNPKDQWNTWGSFQDSMKRLRKEKKSLQEQNRRSNYREENIEAIRQVIFNTAISCERHQTDVLISSHLSHSKAPVHRVNWQSPTLAIFSNRNTFHRRNGPDPAFGADAPDRIFRTNFLETIEEKADANLWQSVRRKISALIP